MIWKLIKAIEWINKTRSWTFEKMNKIDGKPLARLSKKKKRNDSITNEKQLIPQKYE